MPKITAKRVTLRTVNTKEPILPTTISSAVMMPDNTTLDSKIERMIGYTEDTPIKMEYGGYIKTINGKFADNGNFNFGNPDWNCNDMHSESYIKNRPLIFGDSSTNADTVDGKHANEFTGIEHLGSGGTCHSNASDDLAGFMSSEEHIKLKLVDTEMTALKVSNDALTEASTTLTTNVGVVETNVNALNGTLTTVTTKVSALETSTGSLSTKVGTLETDNKVIHGSVTDMGAKITALESANAQMTSTVNALISRIEALEANHPPIE